MDNNNKNPLRRAHRSTGHKHEDSGLLSLYLIHSQKHDGNYGVLADKILKNKDLQNR